MAKMNKKVVQENTDKVVDDVVIDKPVASNEVDAVAPKEDDTKTEVSNDEVRVINPDTVAMSDLMPTKEVQQDEVIKSEDDIVPAKLDSKKLKEIISDDTLPLMDKVERIFTVLPSDRGGRFIRSLYFLFKLRADGASENAMNDEQRTFVREFRALAELPQTEFNSVFKYFRWVYEKLVDVKTLEAEKLPLIKGVSPIDRLVIAAYCANKDDGELATFVYLMAALGLNTEGNDAPLSGSKTTVKNALTVNQIDKLNSFYLNK